MSQVTSSMSGSVWKVLVAEGDQVEVGQTIVILESMKMEIPIDAEFSGTVAEVHVAEGNSVNEGDPLLTLK